MHEYGITNWEGLWEKLEQDGNVGIDFVINPSLYPRVIDFLFAHPKSIVADFGCGTNVMGIQLLFGYQSSIAALNGNDSLGHARFNTLLYVGVEGSPELVRQSNNYLRDIGEPKNIATVQSHISKDFGLFDERTLDLCVSRNFLMHLSLEDFDAHMRYVSRILKPGGCYIFTSLNPPYEEKKAGKTMTNGERYDFPLGKEGEYGTFYHYFKTPKFWRETMEKYFSVESAEPCVPLSDAFRATHARYYDTVPMANTYVLRAK